MFSTGFIEDGWPPASFDALVERSTIHREKSAGMRKVPGAVDNPQVVGTLPYNCMDAGGWYMTFQRSAVIRTMDGDMDYLAVGSDQAQEMGISKAVTRAINGGENGWDQRLVNTRAAKENSSRSMRLAMLKKSTSTIHPFSAFFVLLFARNSRNQKPIFELYPSKRRPLNCTSAPTNSILRTFDYSRRSSIFCFSIILTKIEILFS
jgi:hypothetical protein